MSRIIGTETEYGIATPTDPTISPIITSTHAVVAFGRLEQHSAGTRWDYASEHPLRDQRGFDLKRYQHVPVVAADALGVANVMLANGGRFYVDHAHPEYSSPETDSPYQAMVYDQAGDLVMQRAVSLVAELTQANQSILQHHDPCPALKIYKNNVDGKGASYGSHENYLYHRSTDFDRLAQALIPLFVTRQVIIGAGRWGKGQAGEVAGFQISQRADYIEQEISLETTLNRGIINTRDEPHANADQYGRLHVIIGDANMSQTSTLLKLGITSLVLDAIEAGVDFSDLALVDAVSEVTAVSYDLSLSHKLALRDGRMLTALEILTEYYHRVTPDEQVYPLWGEIMQLLATKGFQGCADRLDWCAKWSLISHYIGQGTQETDPKLALIDLQYADIDPAKSLYHALVRNNRMRTLATPAEIAQAAFHPPTNTRAYFRGRIILEKNVRVESASWESVVIDGARVMLSDPYAFTHANVADLLDHYESGAQLIQQLEQKGM